MISLNVMVVDDSAITVKKIASLLNEQGHNVVATCSTGKQALEQYPEIKPDVVTMDITMPDMNGIEATQGIIAGNPEALILMVTSHGQKQMVLDAIKVGAKGFLLKPIQKDSLQSALEKIVDSFV